MSYMKVHVMLHVALHVAIGTASANSMESESDLIPRNWPRQFRSYSPKDIAGTHPV